MITALQALQAKHGGSTAAAASYSNINKNRRTYPRSSAKQRFLRRRSPSGGSGRSGGYSATALESDEQAFLVKVDDEGHAYAVDDGAYIGQIDGKEEIGTDTTPPGTQDEPNNKKHEDAFIVDTNDPNNEGPDPIFDFEHFALTVSLELQGGNHNEIATVLDYYDKVKEPDYFTPSWEDKNKGKNEDPTLSEVANNNLRQGRAFIDEWSSVSDLFSLELQGKDTCGNVKDPLATELFKDYEATNEDMSCVPVHAEVTYAEVVQHALSSQRPLGTLIRIDPNYNRLSKFFVVKEIGIALAQIIINYTNALFELCMHTHITFGSTGNMNKVYKLFGGGHKLYALLGDYLHTYTGIYTAYMMEDGYVAPKIKYEEDRNGAINYYTYPTEGSSSNAAPNARV